MVLEAQWELAYEDLAYDEDLVLGELRPECLGERAGGRVGGMTGASEAARVRRRRIGRLCCALAAVAMLSLLALPAGPARARGLAPGAGGRLSAGAAYVVRPGDTLWSIALRVDPSGDPRPLVADMAREVGGDTIFPGQRLVLP
ncbi:MAG: LysM peptidoglycan-binding domain-containing protein [Actinomycetota bacterium]|jgi:hypothetical protein|nr:LysM peptidoglycan-binding domain-containing protein [Actinomycetota bacterium]